jgi:hypothetical protein
MNINIDKRDIKRMVNECLRSLLKEDQTAKSISAAIKYLVDDGVPRDAAEHFIRVTLRSEVPVLRTDAGGKFILGVTRMYTRSELNTSNIELINGVIKLIISKNYSNKFDRNLNGLSAADLFYMFKEEMDSHLNTERAEFDKYEVGGNNKYNIVRIDSFEDANKFSDYTSWCITQDDVAFNNYTYNGFSQFYFCLTDNFKTVPREEGEHCPLDEYGLSMIAVSVDRDGRLATCTCRWNHDNGGHDNIMGVEDISKLIGRNFYNVFKPNNKWKIEIENAMERLANGEDGHNVFDLCEDGECGMSVIQMGGKYNFLTSDNKILLKDWYEYAYQFSKDGYGIVKGEFGQNLVDIHGNLVFKHWYRFVDYFREGYSLVRKYGKLQYYFLDKNENQLNDIPFDNALSFEYGMAKVYIRDKGYNMLKLNGEFIGDKWFDSISQFSEGFARVGYSKMKHHPITGTLIRVWKYNFIDKDGNLLTDTWFNWASHFQNGTVPVQFDHSQKQYKLNKNGELLDEYGSVIPKENWPNNKKLTSKETWM